MTDTLKISREDFESITAYYINANLNLNWNLIFTLPAWLRVWWQNFASRSELYLCSIKHNEKIKTTYLNLEQILVSKGAQVSQGDRIATIGAEDDPSSETTHLHFGVIYDDKYLDPEDLLKIDYKSISKFLYLKYIEPDFSVILNQG